MRIFANRKYKSGTRWCVWRWTDVRSKYILRLHLLKTPWFAICLHWLIKPDPEPYLHDHPVTFLSLILRGGYAELRKCPGYDARYEVHRWYNFVRASLKDRHRIEFVRRGTLTLCLMGPVRRTWGYHIPDEGWIPWREYERREKERRSRILDLAEQKADTLILHCIDSLKGTPVDEEVRAIDDGPTESES